jgi:hypothetical protein
MELPALKQPLNATEQAENVHFYDTEVEDVDLRLYT